MKKEDFFKMIEMLKSQDKNIRDFEELGLCIGNSKLIQDIDFLIDILLREIFGEEGTSQIYESIYADESVENLYLSIINQNE